MKVPITKPFFGPEELAAVQKPLETGWVVQGPYVEKFEKAFSEFTGARFAAAASSCTTALHLAVVALGLEPGDEVIVPAFTWVATPNVVEYMGAKPVFCDVDLKTFNLDTEKLEGLVTAKTVGMIPVHLFGLCADMAPILAFAKKHRLWVVEDAACGFGARQRGEHAGTFGDAGCFSFHPRKSITTGEGGMVTTAREEVDRLVRSLRDHGASRTDLARHTQAKGFLLAEYPHVGYNYRLTDIQGALGCAQMARAAHVLAERTKRARIYDEALAPLASWLERPFVPEGDEHGWQSYVCLFRPEAPTMKNVARLHERRNELMARLEERGVATRQGTHAPVIQAFYKEKYRLAPEDFPNAYLADRLSISLPLYPQLTADEQRFVVSELARAF
jgi:perosamine synthetase